MFRFCSWYIWILRPNKFLTWCPRCMIFTQAMVFHPYFMEVTSFISNWLWFNHYSGSKLLKNFKKSIFFGNFKLPLWIFQKKSCINCEYQYLWNHLKVKFSGVSNFIYLNRCKKFQQNLRGSTGELLKNLLTWHGMSQDKNIKI